MTNASTVTSLPSTTPADNEQISALKQHFIKLQQAYSNNSYPELNKRIELLLVIKQQLLQHEQAFYQALSQDYGYRSEFDSLIGDLLPTIENLSYVIRKLKKWLKPERRSAGLAFFPSSVKVHYQPLGVVGVIVPWNFPIFLSIGPMVTALAAGNRVMVKLSEFTPATNQVIIKALAPFSDYICVVEGEADVAKAFSELAFNHLFFTGSTTVGRHVAMAAAKNLTPVTLELGGKSPALISSDANLDHAIDAILFGKCLNSGQVCVSPDYILLPKSLEHDFIKRYQSKFTHYYLTGKNKQKYTAIVNQNQFERLVALIDDAKTRGAEIHTVGEQAIDANSRTILPHLITQISDDMLIMQQEIFGSILPIINYNNISDAIAYINSKSKPLALYLMTQDNVIAEQVIKQTHSGGVCVNDSLIHVAIEDAPFGGIGDSGMGQYHGMEGFKTFSKAKTVVTTSTWLPRSKLLLKYRQVTFNTLRKLFLR